MLRRLIHGLIFFVGLGILSSCQDDPIIQGGDYIPEGKATVSATVSFKPFGSALNGESRTAGNAIKEISSLYVVLYDASKATDNLVECIEVTDYEKSKHEYETGTEGEHIAESEAPCVTFKKVIPYGRYRMYVVANVDLDSYTEAIQSEDGLKSIQLNWDGETIGNNNQMFGYFTTEKNESKPNGWIAPEIVISGSSVSLHAWLRRAASKVTVAFDGKKLNENVYVTIRSVQIKDIPKYCKLGKDYAVEDKDGLIANGEELTYSSSNGDLPVITKGGVTWGSIHKDGWDEPFDPKGEDGMAHTETSQALFFYENMQGEGEVNTSTDKSIKRLDYTQKGKPNGTYVEVKAYYENRNFGSVSSGNIIYRFMLGKDVTIDYNAERNYHYKLTLCFNNDANDVDWRIEYEEIPGIYAPNPYYISYLYSQDMEMPLKVVVGQDETVTELKAEIIENNWEPDGNTAALGSDYYGNGNTVYSAKGADGTDVHGTIKEGNTKIPWLGFLSLKDEFTLNGNKIYLDGQFGADISLYVASNKPYIWWTDQALGTNTYDPESEENTGTTTKSVNYSIPFYTRVKQLYSVSGFTGNNPYVGYNRTAKVRFTATTKKGSETKTYTQDVQIIQVKRMVNPTGIWRDKDNASSFDVVLTDQDGWGGDFHELISDGPWSARMIASTDEDWFTISPTSGVTGSRVAFTYTPKGTTSKPRCGIIEVKYHNNTCSHLIFVRQGYEPIAIHDGGRKWYSFNLKTSNQMTTSPLDEGSLYRYGNWSDPIAEVNNITADLGFGINPGNNQFVLEGSNTKKTWAQITNVGRTESFSSPIGGTTLATLEDWKALKDGLQGYGVLYADGATTIATTTTEAFGYRDAYTGNDKERRGMRGVFAYNGETGANVFFPIGALGYGHRKQQHNSVNGTRYYGVLRYGTVNTLLTGSAAYRPMLYNLYSQNGAIYWTSTLGDAWDINYNQLDFNTYDYSNAWYNSNGGGNDVESDACFVRLVAYD